MEGIIPLLHLLGHSLSVSPSYFPSDAPHPWIPNLIAQDSQPQLLSSRFTCLLEVALATTAVTRLGSGKALLSKYEGKLVLILPCLAGSGMQHLFKLVRRRQTRKSKIFLSKGLLSIDKVVWEPRPISTCLPTRLITASSDPNIH